MYLNIAVVNNSGNVGKSTICETLLKPRIAGSEIIRVETINHDGTDDVKFSADEFDTILKKIDSSDCSIIDVGSSNIESFIVKMEEFKDSHEDIDFFIIPVIPKDKQQIDAVSTASMLLALGVEKDRIKFIFNLADKKQSIEKQYPEFLKGIDFLDFTVDVYPTIFDTAAFGMLYKLNKTFAEVVNDDRDFRALLRQADSTEDRETLSEQRSVKRLVNGLNEELDIAFEKLGIL